MRASRIAYFARTQATQAFSSSEYIKQSRSVRVTRDFRVLGALQGDTIVWFWIGRHADYERLLSRR